MQYLHSNPVKIKDGTRDASKADLKSNHSDYMSSVPRKNVSNFVSARHSHKNSFTDTCGNNSLQSLLKKKSKAKANASTRVTTTAKKSLRLDTNAKSRLGLTQVSSQTRLGHCTGTKTILSQYRTVQTSRAASQKSIDLLGCNVPSLKRNLQPQPSKSALKKKKAPRAKDSLI